MIFLHTPDGTQIAVRSERIEMLLEWNNGTMVYLTGRDGIEVTSKIAHLVEYMRGMES